MDREREKKKNPKGSKLCFSVEKRKSSTKLKKREVFDLLAGFGGEREKMKGMKGKLLKKMKSMRPVGYLMLENRVLQVSSSNGYVVNSCENSFRDQNQNMLICEENTEPKKKKNNSSVAVQEPEVIDVAELMRDLEEDEEEEGVSFNGDLEDKENIGPAMEKKGSGCLKPKAEISVIVERGLRERRVSEASELPEIENRRMPGLSEIDVSSFRKPDLNSYSLFDPNLLDAFHRAVAEHFRLSESDKRNRIEEAKEDEEEPPSKSPRIEQKEDEEEEEGEGDPLLEFEEKCPPGGSDSVILYTTTLRGIRKTFEGCGSIRFLLESFRVLYFERDVSMHAEFREELRRVLGAGAVPPKLFVRGRYVGGAEEVLGLHEQGKLRPLFKDVPIDGSNCPCEGCGGVRFVVCFNCNGSRKVIGGDDDGGFNVCPKCNENGLIICPLCC